MYVCVRVLLNDQVPQMSAESFMICIGAGWTGSAQLAQGLHAINSPHVEQICFIYLQAYSDSWQGCVRNTVSSDGVTLTEYLGLSGSAHFA